MHRNHDIEKLFNQDVQEKKVVSRGVHGIASKRGFVGKVYTPSDFLDGRSQKGRNYRGTGKVEVWNMYEKIIPYEKFETLDNENKREVLIKYQDKYTVDEICEAWGLKNHYHYYKIANKLDLPPRRKKLSRKKAKSTEQKNQKQKSDGSISEMSKETTKATLDIQSAISISLNGIYKAEEASKYIEKIAFLLADLEEKEVKIELNIQHKL